MISIYFVRHGNTEHNKKGLIMGQIDSPLTDEGIESAKRLSKKLEGINFNHVYSSDLGRAFITAHMLVEHLDIESMLFRAKELREIDYGSFANQKKGDVELKCPEYKVDAGFVFPDGESFDQVQNRVVRFVKSLEEKHVDQTVLLITHAGVIRAIVSYFKNLNFQDNLKMPISHEGILELVIDEGKLVELESVTA